MRSRRVLLLVSLGTLVMIWFLLAPASLGGPVTYVVTSGSSMEPAIRDGALVLLRASHDYQVGDVAAYRSPEGRTTLHRIIDRGPNGYVMKGDNNPALDLYQPPGSAMVGKLWVHIPAVGGWLDGIFQLRTVIILILLVATTLVISRVLMRGGSVHALPDSGDMGRNKEQPASMATEAGGNTALILLCVVAAGSLLLAAVSFSQPVTANTVTSIPYEHGGIFEYTSFASSDVYANGIIRTGEPVFRNLASEMEITFVYALTSDYPADVNGTYRVDAIVSTPDGWNRSVVLVHPTAFTGTDVHIGSVLVFDEIDQLTAMLRSEAGIPDGYYPQYQVSVVPTLTIHGTLAGSQLADVFAPRLDFLLDPFRLQVDRENGSSDAERFNHASHGAVAGITEHPGRVSIGGRAVDVAAARSLSLSGITLAAVGGMALALTSSRVPLRRQRDDSEDVTIPLDAEHTRLTRGGDPRPPARVKPVHRLDSGPDDQMAARMEAISAAVVTLVTLLEEQPRVQTVYLDERLSELISEIRMLRRSLEATEAERHSQPVHPQATTRRRDAATPVIKPIRLLEEESDASRTSSVTDGRSQRTSRRWYR